MHDIGKEAIATQCCFAWLSVGLPLTVASGAFQPLAPPEKRASSQVSLCHVLRPSPNSVSGQLRTAFVTIAGCLFTSRFEHLIFNKSNKNEVLSTRKSGDNDLLLLLLFPAQMVLQMKRIKKKIGSSLWLVTGADLAPPVGSHQTHSTPPAQELPTGTCVL